MTHNFEAQEQNSETLDLRSNSTDGGFVVSINTAGASNASRVSGSVVKTETTSEYNFRRKSLVWLTCSAAVGLTASVTLEHLLLPHLTSWEYRAITISAGTAAVACCGLYLTRKLDSLFSE